mmetsp:Transcript_2831/g.11405  ORF Transcript_2831/g.11405 Transcript_2831/m.11405 type:complete len:251 (-) Transcript_2831:67-819(-)
MAEWSGRQRWRQRWPVTLQPQQPRLRQQPCRPRLQLWQRQPRREPRWPRTARSKSPRTLQQLLQRPPRQQLRPPRRRPLTRLRLRPGSASPPPRPQSARLGACAPTAPPPRALVLPRLPGRPGAAWLPRAAGTAWDWACCSKPAHQRPRGWQPRPRSALPGWQRARWNRCLPPMREARRHTPALPLRPRRRNRLHCRRKPVRCRAPVAGSGRFPGDPQARRTEAPCPEPRPMRRPRSLARHWPVRPPLQH